MEKCSNKNCSEIGDYKENNEKKWYCELCFFMKRMDRDGVINAVDKLNSPKT